LTIFNYWGKTRLRDTAGGDDYHLLCWHSLDVAAVGYEMVINNIYHVTDYFSLYGLTDRDKAAQFFAWVLCWHDIGKFAHAFQQKYRHENFSTLNDKTKQYEYAHHTELGFWLWNDDLCEQSDLFPPATIAPYKIKQILSRWMSVVTGHHGRPPEAREVCNHFRPQDSQAAHQFLLQIKALFPLLAIPDEWAHDELKSRFKQLSWLFSAVTVLADWLGSDTRYFPRVASPQPLEDYWTQALSNARTALSALPAASPVAPFTGIGNLFPFIRQPTPLQKKALEIDISAQGPQLFILEDVTGAGKTEAALILTHRLMATGKARGVFLGLPTMATANAMYARMHQTWTALYQPDARPSLVLAHSARHLSDAFSQSVWFTDPHHSARPDEPNAWAQGCAAWFTDSNKKALLAEVGVGTLDQAMMAVMAFKHHNLRLLGLNGKVLLGDEIHACDAWMGAIVENLVETHTRFGNSTILLSATLSQSQRSRLVAAFARGAGLKDEAPVLGLADYPWITHATGEKINPIPVATRPQVERSVTVSWRHSEQDCVEAVLQAVRQGDCIAWIRNSVDDAIAIYDRLVNSGAVARENILLFHSRFAFSDRQRIENKALAWFGKESHAPRAGKVIISTQVLEQSLDLDFDQMISDLAPIDLLIQRAGRLQRHIRDRYGRVKEDGGDERHAPELIVFSPEWNDDPPADWLSATLRNSAYVYPDHGQMWLTQRVLREQGEIRMPQAARLLIEAVYAEGIELPEGLKKASAEQEGKYYCDRAFAHQQGVNFAAGYISGANISLPEKLSTRLAEESITLWLARVINGDVVPYAQGEHAWEMSSLRVRQSWWNKHWQDFTPLEGPALKCWLETQHKTEAIVLVLNDAEDETYSPERGLTGKRS